MEIDLSGFSKAAVSCGVQLIEAWVRGGCTAYSLRDIAASHTLLVDVSPLQDKTVVARLGALQLLHKGVVASCDGNAAIALEASQFLDYVGAPEQLVILSGASCVRLSAVNSIPELAALPLPPSTIRKLLVLHPEWLWLYCGLIRRDQAMKGWRDCLERRTLAKRKAHTHDHRLVLAHERSAHTSRATIVASRLKRVKSRSSSKRSVVSSKAAASAAAGDSAKATSVPDAASSAIGVSKTEPVMIPVDVIALEALGAVGERRWTRLGCENHMMRVLGERAERVSSIKDQREQVLLDVLTVASGKTSWQDDWVWSWVAFASRVEELRAEWDACLYMTVLSQQLRVAHGSALRTYGPRILRDLSRLPGGLDVWYAAVDPIMAQAAEHDWAVVAKRNEMKQQKLFDLKRMRSLAVLLGAPASSVQVDPTSASEAKAALEETEPASASSSSQAWPSGGVIPSTITTADRLTLPSTSVSDDAAASSSTSANTAVPSKVSSTVTASCAGAASDEVLQPYLALFSGLRRWALQFAAAEMSIRDHGAPPDHAPTPPAPYAGESIAAILHRLTSAPAVSTTHTPGATNSVVAASSSALTPSSEPARSTKAFRASRKRTTVSEKAPVAWSSSLRSVGGLPGLSISAAAIVPTQRAETAAQARAKAATTRSDAAAAQRLRTRRAAAARAQQAALHKAADKARRSAAVSRRRHKAAAVIQSAARSRGARRFASQWRRHVLHCQMSAVLCADDGVGLCVVPALFGVPRKAFSTITLTTAAALFDTTTVMNLRGLGGGEGGLVQEDGAVEEIEFGIDDGPTIASPEWVGYAWESEKTASSPSPPVTSLSAAIRAYVIPVNSITALDLTASCNCSDDDFASLAILPKLASLEVGAWANLTSTGVRRFVAGCKNTTILPATPPLLSSREATHGAPARLIVGQVPLRAPPLRSLALSDCRKIDDEALFAIGKGLPGLRDVCLFGCSRVTDRAAASFSGSRARLERLCVAGAYKFGNDALRFLLVSVNPQLHTYISPAAFRRYPYDAGPSSADAFPSGEDRDSTELSLAELTPSKSFSARTRRERHR